MQSVEIFKKTQRSNDDEHQIHQQDERMPEQVLNKEQDPESVKDPLQEELNKTPGR
jgi:hypothetical protein